MFQVLWRYTGVVPEDVPKNVRILKWLPQNDLLGVFTLIKRKCRENVEHLKCVLVGLDV